jgi:hypothetical protein
MAPIVRRLWRHDLTHRLLVEFKGALSGTGVMAWHVGCKTDASLASVERTGIARALGGVKVRVRRVPLPSGMLRAAKIKRRSASRCTRLTMQGRRCTT